MTLLQLALKEIRYRTWNFVFAVLSIVLAAGTITALFTTLSRFDRKTEVILTRQEADLEKRVTQINNDIRDAMLKLDFNIRILPEGQELGDFYAQGYASHSMPASYIEKLTNAGVATLEHLIPVLRRKITWPETKWTVLLIGRGDKIANPVAASSSIPFEPVPRGSVDLGYEIHSNLDYHSGDTVTIMKRDFTVHTCKAQEGTKNDIAIRFHLQDLQELLDKNGMINEIQALEAQHAWSDIAQVRNEITKILPGTRVIEESSLATAKKAARTHALETGRASLQQERENRRQLQDKQNLLAWILIPIIVLISTGWLMILTFRNVHTRRQETGVLMQLGFRTGQIVFLFLLRSFLIALAGGITGFFCGGIFGTLYYRFLETPAEAAATAPFLSTYLAELNYAVLLWALLAAAVIAMIATWIPAFSASREDPADILRYYQE